MGTAPSWPSPSVDITNSSSSALSAAGPLWRGAEWSRSKLQEAGTTEHAGSHRLDNTSGLNECTTLYVGVSCTRLHAVKSTCGCESLHMGSWSQWKQLLILPFGLPGTVWSGLLAPSFLPAAGVWAGGGASRYECHPAPHFHQSACTYRYSCQGHSAYIAKSVLTMPTVTKVTPPEMCCQV